MAWHCSASTNAGLIENMAKAEMIQSNSLIEAMKKVDRANYAPKSPYEDSPQSIGYRATISAPHMHAHAVQHLLPNANNPNAKILDVGCGSGYLAVVFARLNPTSKVYAIDYIPELVELSQTNIMKSDSDLISSNQIKLITGNGWKGFSEGAPYDVIHVGAAAASLPKELTNQLAMNGKMIIPIGGINDTQYLYLVQRIADGNSDSAFKVQNLMGVRYVPLVNEDL
jgi:protein-L-isoaspartate(D-aspartate) O-methyltransferase